MTYLRMSNPVGGQTIAATTGELLNRTAPQPPSFYSPRIELAQCARFDTERILSNRGTSGLRPIQPIRRQILRRRAKD
ncbi:Uncharacterised protein [Mycobacteroides abscessus subsp. abscessus]|nr:Uncharacterised protein [Mycobacteroides abscessus subsp. abscessus]